MEYKNIFILGIKRNPQGSFTLVRRKRYTDNSNTRPVKSAKGPKRGVGKGEMITPWRGFTDPRTINLDFEQLCFVSIS